VCRFAYKEKQNQNNGTVQRSETATTFRIFTLHSLHSVDIRNYNTIVAVMPFFYIILLLLYFFIKLKYSLILLYLCSYDTLCDMR